MLDRIFLAALGIFCIVGAICKDTRIGPALTRDNSRFHPATRVERVILLIGGAVFVIGSLTGWLH